MKNLLWKGIIHCLLTDISISVCKHIVKEMRHKDTIFYYYYYKASTLALGLS